MGSLYGSICGLIINMTIIDMRDVYCPRWIYIVSKVLKNFCQHFYKRTMKWNSKKRENTLWICILFSLRQHFIAPIFRWMQTKDAYLQVDLLAVMIRSLDAFTSSQTRLVVVVDGLDNCEQVGNNSYSRFYHINVISHLLPFEFVSVPR